MSAIFAKASILSALSSAFILAKELWMGDVTSQVTLIAIVVGLIVSMLTGILALVRSSHQNRSEDSGAVRDSQESADLASARALRLDILVAEQSVQIAHLQKQLLEKGPVYTVSFVLRTDQERPAVENVVVNKLAPQGDIVKNGKVVEGKS